MWLTKRKIEFFYNRISMFNWYNLGLNEFIKQNLTDTNICEVSYDNQHNFQSIDCLPKKMISVYSLSIVFVSITFSSHTKVTK